MKTLLIISIISLLLSFMADLIFNLIVVPIKKEMRNGADGIHHVSDEELYNINKPMILREISFLNFLIKKGSFL